MKVKKLIALAAVVSMIGTLAAGCGKKATPESLLTDMNKKIKEVESVEGNISIGAEFEQYEIGIAIKMDLDIEEMQNAFEGHASGSGKVSTQGMSQEMKVDMYQTKEDGEYVRYTKDPENDEWDQEEADKDESFFDFKYLQDLKDKKDSFKLSEKLVKVNKKDCFELTGKIDAEAFFKMNGNDMLDSLDLGEILDEDTIKDKKVPITILIYKDQLLPAKLHINLDDLLSDATEEDTVMKSFEYEISYKSYDNVKKIKLPSEIAKSDKTKKSDDKASDSKTKKNDVKKADGLGEEWDSYTFQINDKVLTLPCTMEDIEALGFTMDTQYYEETRTSDKVEPNDYEFIYFTDSAENELRVTCYNDGAEPADIRACKVGSIDVDDFEMEDENLKVIFPGGLQLGDSVEDFMSQYGEPSEKYESGDYASYTWSNEGEYYKNFEITADENGIVNEISCNNLEIE